MDKEMKYTGCFVICNFGTDERTDSAPVYLMSPAFGRSHTFTVNLCKADIFASEGMARSQLAEENQILETDKHPLAGHLFVAEVFTRPIPKEG